MQIENEIFNLHTLKKQFKNIEFGYNFVKIVKKIF